MFLIIVDNFIISRRHTFKQAKELAAWLNLDSCRIIIAATITDEGCPGGEGIDCKPLVSDDLRRARTQCPHC